MIVKNKLTIGEELEHYTYLLNQSEYNVNKSSIPRTFMTVQSDSSIIYNVNLTQGKENLSRLRMTTLSS
ncbi:hypothetical protein GCM10023220_71700 [Streptomyces ziwulingensis]|uniref:Uncharacterized protein n=1 Tax=Streptomyces ziwulingensis TaxID=1045501 RepID=A0ABP9D4F0_9ACTN